MDWLLDYLQEPDVQAWQALAYVHSLMNVGALPITVDAFAPLLRTVAPDFVSERFPSGVDDAVGLFQRVRPGTTASEMTTLVRIPTAALAASDPARISLVVHLDDSDEAKGNAKYERAWAGVLRASNLYQFLDGFFLTTTTGLQHEEYDALDVVIGPDFGWHEVREMIFVECDDLLDALEGAGLPAPESGFELADESGSVMASAELAWPKVKVGLLRDDEWSLRGKFESAGWQTFQIETVDPAHLVDVLRGLMS